MKTFLVRVAAGGRRLSVPTIASSSIDAIVHVLGALEAQGITACCCGSARLVWRGA